MSSPAPPLPPELQSKVDATLALLRQAQREHGPLTYSNSLGAESMVLTDLLWTQLDDVDIFSLDTGRLHAQTYELVERLEARYGRRLRLVYPDAQGLQAYVAANGVNGFVYSVEARRACCAVRKIEPFRRAVAGFGAWITGVRREQSALRAHAVAVEFDADNGLHKVSPLLDWTHDDVWTYIRTRKLPYNPLHDQGFPSIGCAPCTRAIEPGEDNRAGRWWWENTGNKECGLHPSSRAHEIPATVLRPA
jgi:phosphoadenosine phosphosulfate reductase